MRILDMKIQSTWFGLRQRVRVLVSLLPCDGEPEPYWTDLDDSLVKHILEHDTHQRNDIQRLRMQLSGVGGRRASDLEKDDLTEAVGQACREAIKEQLAVFASKQMLERAEILDCLAPKPHHIEVKVTTAQDDAQALKAISDHAKGGLLDGPAVRPLFGEQPSEHLVPIDRLRGPDALLSQPK